MLSYNSTSLLTKNETVYTPPRTRCVYQLLFPVNRLY